METRAFLVESSRVSFSEPTMRYVIDRRTREGAINLLLKTKKFTFQSETGTLYWKGKNPCLLKMVAMIK